jgi:pyrimidine operon attenuation protein/uracil phosphoribosyltransferase
MSRTKVLEQNQIEQKIIRMAWEIYEQNFNESEIVIAGIQSQGYILAQRISKQLTKISSLDVKLIKLELDKKDPLSKEIVVENHPQLKDKIVVLVDDVLNSGKTLMYSSKYFLNHEVRKLMTAVLVNRNYRQFPIKANVVGVSLSTTMQEHVTVDLGNDESVFLD